MAQSNGKRDEDTVVVGDAKSGYKKFPSQPSTFDYVKEAFQPDDVKAQLNAVRARRSNIVGSQG